MSYEESCMAIEHVTSGGDEPYQVLKVQLRCCVSVWSALTNSIAYEYPPSPLETDVFLLPFHQLNHDPIFFQIYITQLLESLSIAADISYVTAGKLASYILQFTQHDALMDFHVVAEIDNIYYAYSLPILSPLLYPVPSGAMAEPTVVVQEGYTSRLPILSPLLYSVPSGAMAEPVVEEDSAMAKIKSLRRVKLLKEEINGICTICLDEIDCKKCDVVKISCGHVYHKPCISEWFYNSNSCPLCRTPLSLQEASD